MPGDVHALIGHPRYLIRVELRLFELRQHIDELELHRLKLADGRPELLALLGVLQSGLVGCPAGAQCERGGKYPIDGERLVGLHSLLAAGREVAFVRNEHVIDDELRRIGAMGGELLQPAAGHESRRLRVEQEQADGARAPSRVRRRGHRDEIGDDRVRGEHLRALQAVAALHLRRPRTDRGSIRTCVRLRNREGADLLSLDRGHEISLLQLFSTPLENCVGCGRPMHANSCGKSHACRRELITEDREIGVGRFRSETAVPFRVHDPEVPERAEFFEEVSREFARPVQLLGTRLQAFVHPTPEMVPELQLLAVEKAFHLALQRQLG